MYEYPTTALSSWLTYRNMGRLYIHWMDPWFLKIIWHVYEYKTLSEFMTITTSQLSLIYRRLCLVCRYYVPWWPSVDIGGPGPLGAKLCGRTMATYGSGPWASPKGPPPAGMVWSPHTDCGKYQFIWCWRRNIMRCQYCGNDYTLTLSMYYA